MSQENVKVQLAVPKNDSGAVSGQRLKVRKNSEEFRRQIEQMRSNQAYQKKQMKSMRSKKLKAGKATFDGKMPNNHLNTEGDEQQFRQIKMANLNTMHKTAMGGVHGDASISFPKISGLVIKGQGDDKQPVSLSGRGGVHKVETSAYALSPKLLNQLRIDENFKQEEKKPAEDVISTEGMTVAQIHMHRMRKEKELQENEEKRKRDEVLREMNEIRSRYTQFKHCSVSEEAMRAFAQYMKEKMTSKQYKKQQLRDLGLAAIDSFVIFDQMQRNDSKKTALKSTSENRASLKDMNATRPNNYLNSYLERVTEDVKVPRHLVPAIQDESILDGSMSNWDRSSSLQKGSLAFHSKKGSYDFMMAGSSQPSRNGFFPNLLPSDRVVAPNLTAYNTPVEVQLKTQFHSKRQSEAVAFQSPPSLVNKNVEKAGFFSGKPLKGQLKNKQAPSTEARGQSTLFNHNRPSDGEIAKVHGGSTNNNLASMDCLIMPQPSAQNSINMSPAQVSDYAGQGTINHDLRNFAKSSTNLDKHVTNEDYAAAQNSDRKRSIKKERVIFKDEPREDVNVRIVDDDEDSVQHLDLSVIGDHNQDEQGGSKLIQHIKLETERAQMKMDEYDFKNKNLRPKQLLLRPNRSKIAELQNQRLQMQSISQIMSQASINGGVGQSSMTRQSITSKSKVSLTHKHQRSSKVTITPFKAQAQQSRLNMTIDNMRQSRKSFKSGSLENARMMNESINSFNDQKRNISLVSAADKIMKERKRHISEVRQGYKSNEMFEHTIADIIRVLESKIKERKALPENESAQQRQMNLPNLRHLDSDSDPDEPRTNSLEKVETVGANLQQALSLQVPENNLADKQLVFSPSMAQNLLDSIKEIGLDEALSGVQSLLKSRVAQREIPDSEVLSESILFQYAYLERLIKICKDERNPKTESQRLIKGKDKKYNQNLSNAREAVENLMKMAEKAQTTCAEDKDAGPTESKPYDQYYYGQLSNIAEFKSGHRVMTQKVLEKAGGKFATMRQTNNHFWKPKSKVFTKDFVKRFPKFAGQQ